MSVSFKIDIPRNGKIKCTFISQLVTFGQSMLHHQLLWETACTLTASCTVCIKSLCNKDLLM